MAKGEGKTSPESDETRNQLLGGKRQIDEKRTNIYGERTG